MNSRNVELTTAARHNKNNNRNKIHQKYYFNLFAYKAQNTHLNMIKFIFYRYRYASASPIPKQEPSDLTHAQRTRVRGRASISSIDPDGADALQLAINSALQYVGVQVICPSRIFSNKCSCHVTSILITRLVRARGGYIPTFVGHVYVVLFYSLQVVFHNHYIHYYHIS